MLLLPKISLFSKTKTAEERLTTLSARPSWVWKEATEEAGLVTTPEDETDAQRTPSSIKLCAVGYRCRPSSSKEAQEADVFRGGSLEEESLKETLTEREAQEKGLSDG